MSTILYRTDVDYQQFYLETKFTTTVNIGAVDENTELGMDFSSIKAQQLPPILHD